MLNHKTNFNTFQGWGNFPDMHYSILPALKISILDQEQVTTRWCIWVPQDTSPSPPPPTHPELAACRVWSNKRKGREVTLDGYWVNGLSVFSGDFFKSHFNSINSSSSLSYDQWVGLTQLLQKVGKEFDAPPEKGLMVVNTGFMSRGLQFVTTSDKPKCNENWDMPETGSKPASLLLTRTQSS